MLIYNTTFHIEGPKNSNEFVNYVRKEFYPQLTPNNHGIKARFVKLVTDMGNNMNGFALMIEADSLSSLKKWKQEIGDSLMEKLRGAFNFEILSFSTTMIDMID